MSRRERLLGRQRPSVQYLLLVDRDGAHAAQEALASAQVEATAARAAADRAELVVATRKDGPAKGRAALVRTAEADLVRARARQDETDRALADAEAAVNDCYDTITLQAMVPDALEVLVAAHPPTDKQLADAEAAKERERQTGQAADPPPVWNNGTFQPALLAACTPHLFRRHEGAKCAVCGTPEPDSIHITEPGDEMTAVDWHEFLGSHVSEGEKRDLWRTVLELNHRVRVADPVVLPKDWTRILSSLSS